MVSASAFCKTIILTDKVNDPVRECFTDKASEVFEKPGYFEYSSGEPKYRLLDGTRVGLGISTQKKNTTKYALYQVVIPSLRNWSRTTTPYGPAFETRHIAPEADIKTSEAVSMGNKFDVNDSLKLRDHDL